MDLVPGVYPLGADATLNLFGALVKALGGKEVLKSTELDFTKDDTLVYSVDGDQHTLLFVPAPTDEEIKESLDKIGIKYETASDAEKDLMRQLLKAKGGA